MEQELNNIVNRWVLKAENDIKTADQGFRAEEIITDTICFHCQQAVEKYLKAYLVANGIVPDKTHKIELLLNKCTQIDQSFESLINTVTLSDYSIELRYPDDFFIPSLEEAKHAFELAVQAKKFIINKLPK